MKKLNNSERKDKAAAIIRQLSEQGITMDDVRKIFSTGYSLAKAQRPLVEATAKPDGKTNTSGRLSTPKVKP